jgi:signal transduction histidine kinase
MSTTIPLTFSRPKFDDVTEALCEVRRTTSHEPLRRLGTMTVAHELIAVDLVNALTIVDHDYNQLLELPHTKTLWLLNTVKDVVISLLDSLASAICNNSVRMRSAFIYAVADDIRTPFNAIADASRRKLFKRLIHAACDELHKNVFNRPNDTMLNECAQKLMEACAEQ